MNIFVITIFIAINKMTNAMVGANMKTSLNCLFSWSSRV